MIQLSSWGKSQLWDICSNCYNLPSSPTDPQDDLGNGEQTLAFLVNPAKLFPQGFFSLFVHSHRRVQSDLSKPSWWSLLWERTGGPRGNSCPREHQWLWTLPNWAAGARAHWAHPARHSGQLYVGADTRGDFHTLPPDTRGSLGYQANPGHCQPQPLRPNQWRSPYWECRYEMWQAGITWQ